MLLQAVHDQFSLWLIALFAASSILLWRLFAGSSRSRLIDLVPGPRGLPIVGNLFEIMEPTTEVLPAAMKRVQRFGPIHRMWLGPMPVVYVASAIYIEPLLSNSEELKKGFIYKMLRPLLGNGILISSGEQWHKHRKLISTAFHSKILESFIPAFESNSQILVKKLAPLADSGEVFDIHPHINLCALDVICETAMGFTLNAQSSDKESEYTGAIHRLMILLVERFMRIYMHPDLIFALTPAGREFARCIQVMHDFTENVIKERRLQRESENPQESGHEKGAKKKLAFLDLLLDEGDGLSDAELRDEVETLMFAGHDTTGASTNWTIYLLGRHPEIQERVFQEVLSVWPMGSELALQRLNEMKLLERVIKESLRLFPSVPMISRTLEKDTRFGEYILPANTDVIANIHVLHRDEEYFPDPEKFDPDRFLRENMENRHPYAYVPFSAGPRNCLGQKFSLLEEKTILASLLKEYKFTAVDSRDQVIVSSQVVSTPDKGIRVTIEKRT